MIIAKIKSRCIVHALLSTVFILSSMLTGRAAEMVVNGTFDENAGAFGTWPGYVGNGVNPADVPSWRGEGGRGINPVDDPAGPADMAPFRNNGDNDTSVAFLQQPSFLEQDVTGFTVGLEYLLSLDYNARSCCGGLPRTELSLNGELLSDYPDPDLFPDGIVQPVGGDNPWYRYETFFIAETETITLRVAMENIGGDASFVFDNVSITGGLPPLGVNGGGDTYSQDFDTMGTGTRLPKGWKGEDVDGITNRARSLGLVDGPLEGAVDSAAGIVNAGGTAERFSAPADGRVGTWKDDLDGSGDFDEADVIADAATDRALGIGRVNSDDVGILTFEVEISDSLMRAFVADWDLEVWGGDPEGAFRGPEGGGYATDLQVNGTSYYSETVTHFPGELFDTSFDLSPGAVNDPTLINGNDNAVRSNTSGIVEVTAADGAVGNPIVWTFDADHGGNDQGWIQAIDNVQFRALAAGDAQADGDVDPADLIQLLAGGAFGQGNIDATWGQGDFDNDGDFDGTDILAVVQGLAGEFPKTYAHDPSNGVPDVLINPATGNITLDTNGTTIGSIVMDSAAGIFNGPNSPSWDAPGDFAADIDTQISMPISFTNPGYTGVDDLGDGIIGDLAPGFDILADLTIKYLDPNGDLLDAEAHVVPEPSSLILFLVGGMSLLMIIRHRNRS